MESHQLLEVQERQKPNFEVKTPLHTISKDDVPIQDKPSPSHLPTFLQKRQTKTEEPKVVLERPLKGFLNSCLIHLLPLGVCIYLIWLNQVQYFWFEDERPTVLNSLQFAAKVLEILILGSLSAMVLHHARRHFLSINGLPLGLLQASYRATDVMMAFESQFWSTIFQKPTWRLGVLILLVALFSVLVGPAAAIALIPSPGWYAFPEAFSNATNKVLFLNATSLWRDSVLNTSELLYQTRLTNATYSWGANCLDMEIAGSYYCPGKGFQHIVDWLVTRRSNGFPAHNNVTMFESLAPFSYPALFIKVNRTANVPVDTAVATVPYENLIRALGYTWRDIKSRKLTDVGPVSAAQSVRFSFSPETGIFQPVVQAQCTWPGNTRTSNDSFATLHLKADGILTFDKPKGWAFDNDAQWEVPREFVSKVLDMQGKREDAFRVEWVNAEDVDAGRRFSIGALVSIPPNAFEDGQSGRPLGARRIIPCAFTAYWMPSTMTLDPQAQPYISTNGTDGPNPIASAIQSFRNGTHKPPQLPAPLDLIQIDRTWATALDVNINSSLVLVGSSSMMDRVLNAVLSSVDISYPNSTASERIIENYIANITLALNAHMALGLSSFGYRPELWFQRGKNNSFKTLYQMMASSRGTPEREGTPDIIPPVADAEITVEHYGFSYGARNETVLFAFIVIYTYIGVLVLYVALALWDQLTHHPNPIVSWSGIQDVLVLALNSSPPEQGELMNCGPGTDTTAVWKQCVKVRADDDGKLELVFKEKESLVQLTPRKSYK